ncbi:HIT family protein [Mesorhizobium sp. WSM3873]|uniref:HIT family protein n=1 Tax=Mesorhizobium sp. WSM3873 TaxID=1854056 RepID=UPI0009ED3C26|nr:HIT family protein [Mesorhizobium sp. WSM3873]TIU44220.1 MAG: HIT family protein [Mesorhizobium sp.]TIW60096.1 MAG: HIT family protein [Mesorhizobium sp.]TJW91355.1 MAG: HIT family protein [Mesorhizobium sp.]
MTEQADNAAGSISELVSRFHDRRRWIGENSLAFAIADAYPVSEGHTLVVPKRRTTSTAELSPEELLACFELIELQKRKLASENGAQGFNIGVNEGPIAGQTVEQLHFHLIPRYPGDVTDPVGGVRNIFPGKGDYLRKS